MISHAIIIYDNSMSSIPSLSHQLKQHRQALGLSLSGLARRTGTSPATLSRYENGWTRFETYTLKKLAVALNCELRIELVAHARRTTKRVTAAQVTSQLRRLFWDHPLSPDDLDHHAVWVMERVLEYGSMKDVELMTNFLGRKNFLALVAKATRVSPKTRNFWQKLLTHEEHPCTKKFSRNTAWNC